MSSKKSVAVAAPNTSRVVDTGFIQNNIQEIVIAKQNHITNSVKNAPRQVLKKNHILYKKFKQNSYIHVNPRDTSIKDLGLQRAKDAMDDEGNWITAFFVFLGLLVLFLLQPMMIVLSLGIILSEEIFGLLIIAMSVSLIGSIVKYYKNRSVVLGYPSEEKRHSTHYTILGVLILAIFAYSYFE